MDEDNIYRRCVSCNELKPRTHLIKVTYSRVKNELRVSPDSSFVGRSVYICKCDACVNQAFRKSKLYKYLRVRPDNGLEEKIRAVLRD